MKPMIACIVLCLAGCATTPPPKATPRPLPPPPVLSEKARKDPQLAYSELVEKYKELRTFAKEQQRPVVIDKPVEICTVKIGDIRVPMIGLGEIHFVIFSYCRLADNRNMDEVHP